MNRSVQLFCKSFAALTLFLCSFSAFAQSSLPTIYVDGATICPGENVSVAIRVENFTDITSLQFTIHWEPGMLELDTFSNVQSYFITTNAFFGTDEADKGVFSFSWWDPPLQGFTVDNEEMLFTLDFKSMGGNGSSVYLTFPNDPTPFEISQNVNGDAVLVEGLTLMDSVLSKNPEVTHVAIEDELDNAANGSVDITVDLGIEPYTYLWNNNAATEDLTNVPADSYFVTVTDDNGCQYIGGPYVVEALVGTGHITSATEISIFPNPASDNLSVSIDFNKVEKWQLELYDVLGKRYFSEAKESAEIQAVIRLGDFPEGTYLLKINTSSGHYLQKISVVH